MSVVTTVAGLGGGAGVRPHPPWRPSESEGLPVSKTVRTADSTIIIITNFYLAAIAPKLLVFKHN